MNNALEMVQAKRVVSMYGIRLERYAYRIAY